MTDALQVEIYGIKCDHCDYKDMSVQLHQYPEYVNKPCPECGENLLTEEDYVICLKMIEAAELINEIIPATEGEPQISATINLDGSGKVTVKEIECVKGKKNV